MEPVTISQLVPLFQTLVWALVVFVVVLSLRPELKKLLDKMSGADDLQMSLGSLTVQARTMRELHRSIGTGFPEETISKADLEALLDIKIKSIQAAMEHTLKKSDIRSEVRIAANEKVKIIRGSGKVVEGTTVDVSEAGIGFKSDKRLRFGEIVKIKSSDPRKKISSNGAEPVRIVRVEEAMNEYYYGATVFSAL
jgi:hypothetical protein